MKFIIYANLTQLARAENLKSRSVTCHAIASWIHSYFDNVMTKFTINNRTDAWKTDVNLTNRFHVAVRLFSNKSQMTSKCGKNKKVAHEAQPSVSLMFLPHFDVLCYLLLNWRTATWNLFVLYNKKLKYTDKNTFFYFKFRHFDRDENSTDMI